MPGFLDLLQGIRPPRSGNGAGDMAALLGMQQSGPAAPAVAAAAPSPGGIRPSDVTQGQPPMGAMPPELAGMPPELVQAIMAMGASGAGAGGAMTAPMNPPMGGAPPTMAPPAPPPRDVMPGSNLTAQGVPGQIQQVLPPQFGIAQAHETWRQGFFSANGRWPTPKDVADKAWTMDFVQRVGRLPTKLEYLMQTQPQLPPDGASDFM